MKKKQTNDIFPEFCGVASLGERGQVVIPKEARTKLGLKKGDEMMVLRHTDKLILVNKKSIRKFIKHLTSHINI